MPTLLASIFGGKLAAGPILLKRDIQHGTLRAREHEIALPDAGRQELAGIFAGHLYAFTDLQ